VCVAYALWKWEAATSLVQALDSFSIVRERETFPALRPPPLRLVAAPATVADCSYLHRPYRHERTRLTDLVRAHLASSRLASPRFVSPCVASFRPLHGAHSKHGGSTQLSPNASEVKPWATALVSTNGRRQSAPRCVNGPMFINKTNGQMCRKRVKFLFFTFGNRIKCP